MDYFLRPEDYNAQIRAQILNLLTDDVEDTLHHAELSAQEEMESYLRLRFDVGHIFSLDQEPKQRSKQIVMYLVDITLYHLHSNITPNNVPEIRYLRYNRAKEWLKMVADGRLSPNLPPIVSDETFPHGGSQFFYGDSHDKVTQRY